MDVALQIKNESYLPTVTSLDTEATRGVLAFTWGRNPAQWSFHASLGELVQAA